MKVTISKRVSLLLLAVTGFLLTISAQQGKVIEELTVKSAIRGKNVKYAVYLTPDYDVSQRSYPVVYLLHGYTDDHTGWLQFGE